MIRYLLFFAILFVLSLSFAKEKTNNDLPKKVNFISLYSEEIIPVELLNTEDPLEEDLPVDNPICE